MIKKYFLTGLALLLPFVITIGLVIFLINFFTGPFQTIFENILNYFDILNHPLLLHQSAKILVLVTLFFMILFIGFLANLVLGKYVIRMTDFLIHRTPFINKIYKVAQEVVNTIFNSNASSFSQVVLVPFPYDQILSIGLVPSGDLIGDSEGLISIFIPGTPNPTGGFLLKFKKEELIFVDMKVEDAIKFVVSCGVLSGEEN